MFVRCQSDFDLEFLSPEFLKNLKIFLETYGDKKVSFFDCYENLVEIYHDFDSEYVLYIQKTESSHSPFCLSCDSFEILSNQLIQYYADFLGSDEKSTEDSKEA